MIVMKLKVKIALKSNCTATRNVAQTGNPRAYPDQARGGTPLLELKNYEAENKLEAKHFGTGIPWV